MICCLNPSCPQENPSCSEDMNYCTSCGQPLVLLLDRYLPIGRMITGDSTVAYFARDREGLVNNDCVIRQLSIHNPQVRELAELEVKRLQQLSRENSQICEILNYHVDGEYLYLIQSFVEGQNLEKYLERHGVFSEEEVINFLTSLLGILESTHSKNIIHRDLRLDNIIRRNNGELVLSNFAVNRQSTGNIFEFDSGIPGYTPFELKEQSISHPPSDLFSLGAACFHLLTGKHPQIAFGYLGDDWTSKWQEYLDRAISGDLSKVIDKLLQKNYRERYQSARDVSKALRSVSLQNIDRQVKQDRSQHLVAGSTTRKMQSKVSINRLMNTNDPHSNVDDRSSTEINNSEPSVGAKLLLESPQKKMLAIASMLVFGSLATAVIVFPSIERQFKSADRSSIGEATSAVGVGDSLPLGGSGSAESSAKADATGTLSTSTPTREIENSNRDFLNSNSADLNTSVNRPDNKDSSIANRGTLEGLTESITRNPRDANSYFERGNIRANSNDKKGAIADYTQSITIDPKESEVYSQRGNAYSAIGDKKAAIADYTQVIKLEPDRADAYFHRAIDRSNIGDKKGAVEDYTQVIRLEPDRADAYFDRGNTRAAIGDKKGAIEDLTKSIQYKPNRAATYKNRGNARMAIGDKQGAAEDYLRASKLAKK
jgi:serine/threonine protein kinase/lipoprotein NlpI